MEGGRREKRKGERKEETERGKEGESKTVRQKKREGNILSGIHAYTHHQELMSSDKLTLYYTRSMVLSYM